MTSVIRTRRTAQLEPQSLCNNPSAQSGVAVSRVDRVFLLSYHELPAWSQDNEYILYGYRPASNSAVESLLSWTYLHNETANIYTHFFSALCFAVMEILGCQYFIILYPEATVTDRLVFAFFLLAAVTCLGLSTTYHTLMNHSAEVSHFWLRMDYVGIVGLILGDIVSGTYVVFYCQSSIRTFYWQMVALFISTISCLVLLHPKFQGPQWRLFRASTFVCTGLSAVVPLIHALSLFGTVYMIKHSGLPYYLLEGLLHFLGVFVYATRIPESLKPGRFDIWCSSHQIFHVLVVLATVAQLVGVWSVFDYKYSNRVCQAP